jgi:4-hydroxybenzoate polyprenyltransferase
MSRPINLLMVSFTMIALRFWLIEPVLRKCSVEAESSDFIFMTMMTVLVILTASGNIINDYFDVRVDRINKPQRVIIDKKVKRRVAIIAHFALNAVAVFLSLVASWKSGIYLFFPVAFLLTVALWFYSTTLKKQFLTGNLLVAAMVSTVPFVTGLTLIKPGLLANAELIACFPMAGLDLSAHDWAWAGVLGYTSFAFHLTLIREIQKDMEDAEGDGANQFKTMAVVLGIRKSGVIVGLLLLVALALTVAFEIFLLPHLARQPLWPSLALTLLVQLPLVVSLWLNFKSSGKDNIHRAQIMTKLAMAGGLILLAFL